MRQKIKANEVIDLYILSKKLKGIKKQELMKKIIYMSQHLNEFIDLDKVKL